MLKDQMTIGRKTSRAWMIWQSGVSSIIHFSTFVVVEPAQWVFILHVRLKLI